jgi:hypothetical protein
MAVESITHSHPDSWRETMDWPELQSHLINTHGQPPEEIDHLDFVDGTLQRRTRAEDIHQNLHRALRSD